MDGTVERFRLVGMDHWNAMFEDESTGSWWRQATGEAVAGRRKGMKLAEMRSDQVTLRECLAIHPESLVMEADPAFADSYPKDDGFEEGTSRKRLTGTNPESWQEKSWVVGIEIDGRSKAFDWNRLRKERVINDSVAGTPIVLVLAADEASFFAFERPDADALHARGRDARRPNRPLWLVRKRPGRQPRARRRQPGVLAQLALPPPGNRALLILGVRSFTIE